MKASSGICAGGCTKGTVGNDEKGGITAAQCALGFRAAMIMNKIGVKEGRHRVFHIGHL